MIKNFLVGPNDSEILVHQTHMHICINHKQSKVLEITRNLFSIVPNSIGYTGQTSICVKRFHIYNIHELKW